MVSTRPTVSQIVTFMLQTFFQLSSKVEVLILILIIHSLELFTSALADVVFFYWILSDSKSPQVSGPLFSILDVLNNAVVWMVSTRPPTSESSSPFSNPLVTVPNAPIRIGIITPCMFHTLLLSSLLLSFTH